MHSGLMDLYPLKVGRSGPPPNAPPLTVLTNGQVMGYFDGNTVTALWNYAQHFALADNFFNTNFGPSTPGVINLVSGQTNGMTGILGQNGNQMDGGNSMTNGLSMIGDADTLSDVAPLVATRRRWAAAALGTCWQPRNQLWIVHGRI
jgi:phospholipase C